MWQYNGTTIRVGRSFTDDNGITHPSVWSRWTNEYKQSMGLTWLDDPVVESYDDRFYFSANNPKHLEDVEATDFEGNPVYNDDSTRMINTGLKSQWITRTKQTANSLLQPTDWYAVRQVETGLAIPETTINYRASVRAAANSIESAINGCTTLEEFQALFTVPVDDQGQPTGKAIINGWPDA